jgi:hypothetical protein
VKTGIQTALLPSGVIFSHPTTLVSLAAYPAGFLWVN